MTVGVLTNGLIGATTSRRTTDQEFALGTVAHGENVDTWVYGQANGSVATGTCTFTASTGQITDAAGSHTADTAFADNEYGWVRLTADTT
jgi:hypothetical protein